MYNKKRNKKCRFLKRRIASPSLKKKIHLLAGLFKFYYRYEPPICEFSATPAHGFDFFRLNISPVYITADFRKSVFFILITILK